MYVWMGIRESLSIRTRTYVRVYDDTVLPLHACDADARRLVYTHPPMAPVLALVTRSLPRLASPYTSKRAKHQKHLSVERGRVGGREGSPTGLGTSVGDRLPRKHACICIHPDTHPHAHACPTFSHGQNRPNRPDPGR